MMNLKIQKAEDGKNAGSAKKCVQTGKKVADKKEANKKQAAQVAVFENPEFGTVRTATDEKDEPWFCAKDLCDVLGYKRADLAVNSMLGLAMQRNAASLELLKTVMANVTERCRSFR